MAVMSSPDTPASERIRNPAGGGPGPDLDRLLGRVARGDQQAFDAVYDRLAGPAYGLIRAVVRDPAQSEEVAQEVLLEIWRTAARFDPARGSAMTWAMMIAHRRASRPGPVLLRPGPARPQVRRCCRQHRRRRDRRRRGSQAGPGAGPALPGDTDRHPARVGHSRLLRWLQLPRGRRTVCTSRSAPSRPGSGTGSSGCATAWGCCHEAAEAGEHARTDRGVRPRRPRRP